MLKMILLTMITIACDCANDYINIYAYIHIYIHIRPPLYVHICICMHVLCFIDSIPSRFSNFQFPSLWVDSITLHSKMNPL